MQWVILIVVLAALAVAVVLLTIRFNQLSLNRSLTVEARRQFDVARFARHGLMPVFLAESRRVLGDVEVVQELENAIVTAESARGRADAGVAEYVVTDASRAVVVALAAADSTDAHLARELYSQVDAYETHIGASVRHHNASVRRYERRRTRLLSSPWRSFYPSVREISYTPSELDEDAIIATPSPGSENYRPGRVGEDL